MTNVECPSREMIECAMDINVDAMNEHCCCTQVWRNFRLQRLDFDFAMICALVKWIGSQLRLMVCEF